MIEQILIPLLAEKFTDLKVAAVVVTFEPLEGAKKWISETGSKLEVFVDAERKMYDFFGLSRSIYKVRLEINQF